VQQPTEVASALLVPLGALESELNASRQTVGITVLGVALAVAVWASIVALFLSRKITFPISRLRDAADKASIGEQDLDIAVDSQDEIGDLAMSFNKMIVARKQAEEELRQHRDNLEVMVTSRTTELAKANKQLLNEVSERKRAEEKQEELNSELEEKNKELEQIVYVASHDLRSPLVNVQGFSKELSCSLQDLVSILQKEDISPLVREEISPIIEADMAEAVTTIQVSTLKMDSLLSGLLRFSRLGQAALNFEQLDMNRMLSEIVKGDEYNIRMAKVAVEVGDLPPCMGDCVQMNQVFSNLLENARKYLEPTRPGIIEITGLVEGDEVVYCVEDNGIGIPEKERTKVFQLFHRLDPGISNGEGLGLSVVKKILSRHGGKIWVESEPGVGSKFFVSLAAIK
jgi:signal transduction histidine kinase